MFHIKPIPSYYGENVKSEDDDYTVRFIIIFHTRLYMKFNISVYYL